jgi:prepilin-type processing-associated H-X9-DG protein
MVLVLTLVVATSTSATPPLAEKLPSQTLAYAGWAGAEAIGGDFGETRTKALLDASELPTVATEYLPELLAALSREVPDAAVAVEIVREAGPILWRKPVAVAFGGIDWESELNDGDPLPRMIFVCDAGEEAANLRAALTAAFTTAEVPELVTRLREHDGVVYWQVGYDDLDLAGLAAGRGDSLATRPGFGRTSDLTQTMNSGVTIAGYADSAALRSLVEEVVQREEGEQAVGEFRRVVTTLGLDAVGTISYAAGFQGRDAATAAFVEVPGDQRNGLLRMMPKPGQALDATTLAAVPGDATIVAAGWFDAAEVLPFVREMVNEFDPDSAGQLEQVLGFANMFVGADIEQGVLQAVGDTMAAYVSPSLGQDITSAVVVSRPRKPAELRQSFLNLSLNANSMGGAALRQETDGLVRVPGRTLEVDGEKLYVLNAPLLGPTWGVTGEGEDALLRLGLLPQSVMGSMSLDQPAFATTEAAKLVADVADGNEPTAFVYTDLPAMATNTYPAILILSQTAFGAGDLFGDFLQTRPPVAVLPPLPVVMANLTPSAAAAWVDDDGVHMRSREPFLGSGVLVDTGTAGGQVFQLIGASSAFFGTLQPSLSRSRESANRIKSASNLRMIGQAMRQHAIEDIRAAMYPTDMGEFVLEQDVPINSFVSPRSSTTVPAGLDDAAAARWVNDNSDYVYLGNGLSDIVGPRVMVGFESPAATGFDNGVNVLFGDGSVRFETLAQLDELYREHLAYRAADDRWPPLDPATQRKAEAAMRR